MKTEFRLIEQPWEIARRSYSVQRCWIEGWDGYDGYWSTEQFFSNPLDAQLFMAKLSRGPLILGRITLP